MRQPGSEKKVEMTEEHWVPAAPITTMGFVEDMSWEWIE